MFSNSILPILHLVDESNSVVFFFLFCNIIAAFSYFFPKAYFAGFRKTTEFNFVIFSLFLVLFITPFFLFLTTNLLLFYVLLEIITFSFLLLIALNRKVSSLVSAIQYLIYNTVASSFFLLGIIIIYIYTFSLNIVDITSFFHSHYLGLLKIEFFMVPFFNSYSTFSLLHNSIFVFGQFLIFFSLCWKLAVFPLHFWVIDFYENIPFFMMAISSTILVFWYFCFFFYLLKYMSFLDKSLFLDSFLLVSMAGSVLFGAIGIVDQVSLKRFLAFSSVFNIGFLLVSASHISEQALTYIFLYCFSNFIIFSILIYITSFYLKSTAYIVDLKFLRGNLYLGLPFIFVIFTLSGLPPFPGFFIKYSVLASIYQFNNELFFYIFVIVLLNTLASFAYLTLLKIIFFDVDIKLVDNVHSINLELYNNHFNVLVKKVYDAFPKHIVDTRESSNTISFFWSFYFFLIIFFLFFSFNPSLVYTIGSQLYTFL